MRYHFYLSHPAHFHLFKHTIHALKERGHAVMVTLKTKDILKKHLLKHQIPILGCLWNDVLHFSAVHPGEIKKSLIEAGDKKEFKLRYFQVDPKLLKSESTIVYLYAHADVRDKLNEVNFVSYAPDEAAKYSSMPQATKDYYKETIEKGGRPLLYHRIPHILYKGNLDITDLPVISI